TDLVLKTLESAVKNRTITGDLIIHTDLGSQYTSDDYNQRLTELHIRHSYSRKGCPYDNAPMESFHASYNRKRIHSSLGYQTPLQVEIATLTSQMAA
ncbi:DDE-type integrase/transposase/recombinase, partial [Lactiplantibacillus plantarum]